MANYKKNKITEQSNLDKDIQTKPINDFDLKNEVDFSDSKENTDDMVFEQHKDGSYSVKNKQGDKIYSDELNITERDENENFTNINDNDIDVKLNETKKKKKVKVKLSKEEKKKQYEKKTFRQKMQTLGILIFVGIFTGSGLGVWYFNHELRSSVDYSSLKPEDYIQSVDDTLSKNNIDVSGGKENWVASVQAQNKTPLDFSPVDNFVLAEYNSTLADSFTAIGVGKVISMGVTQTIYSGKKYDGNKYTFESISNGMVPVASCDVLNKGANSIAVYSGSNATDSGATWTYNNDMSTDQYELEVGNLPSVIQPYIISDKTVDSSTEVVYDEATGHYSFTLNLHKIFSVIKYAKQVKRTGGLGSFPEFNSISQEITIDKDWNLISINVTESYKAVAFGMAVTCNGTLNTNYTFNKPVELPV